MQNGWIKLYRKSFENQYYFSERFTKWQAWVDLLLLANHKDNYFEIRGNPITVKRGEIGYANETLAKRWRWSRGKVERYLKCLEKTGQIEQQKSKILTLIIIKNYERYQADEATDRATENHQKIIRRSINKNDKNDKNDKNILADKSADEINSILNEFYVVNPTLNYGNITQRKIIEELVKKWGYEKTINTVRYAITIQGKPYSPVITTPLQLKNKMGDLLVFHKKEGNSSKFTSI